MKKDVLISIKDYQISDGAQENIELTTKGKLSGCPADYKLEFTESFDDENICSTTLSVKDRRCVSMLRKGPYSSELIIEQDKRHNCHYVTPYGEFMVGIFAKSVRSSMDKKGGVLKMNYTVDYYEGYTQENEMTIEVGTYD